MATKSNIISNEPVTAVFSLTVNPGKEKLFENMMHDVHRVARTFPGHMGVTILNNPAKKASFQIILRFDNTTHLEVWLNSPIRQKLMKPIEKISKTSETTKANGLETWFDIPGQQVIPPPKWKMALTTSIAIYPLSLLFTFFLAPHILKLHAVVRALFLPILAPAILTYLFMPFLTQHVLKRWLYKKA